MTQRYVSTEAESKAYRRIFKKLGLKLTHQRFQIFSALMSMNGHPSAEDVLAVVKPKIPTISFDTVYRTLALFERHGLIAKVQYVDDKTRYDSETRPHCHLICTRCRRIEDFFWPDIEQLQIPDETARWGKIENRYVELRGICKDCLAKDAQE